MVLGSHLSPEQQAYFAVIGIAAGLILLADMVLLWVVVAGWLRGRSLLARRWSAAHVLIAFQAWLLPTLGIGVVAGIALAIAAPDPKAEALLEHQWMSGLVAASVLIQSAAMAAVVLFTVLVSYDQRLVATGLSLRNWRPKAAIGLLAAAGVIPLSLAGEYLSTLALRHAPLLTLIQRSYEEQLAELMGILHGPGGLVLGLLVIGFIGPFGEELFFRGFAYRCFRARWGPLVGMLSSAFLFSVTHLNPAGLLSIFAIGCALAYLYERTGTLVAPFALHAANNIAAVLVAYFGHTR